MTEMVLFCSGFLPDTDFENFIVDCGYTVVNIVSTYFQISDINFDERVITYVKEHSNYVPYCHKDAIVLKGKPTYTRKIGFLGTAVLLEVDTNKTWTITYDHRDDHPIIKYQKVMVSPYGQIKLVCEENNNDNSVNRS